MLNYILTPDDSSVFIFACVLLLIHLRYYVDRRSPEVWVGSSETKPSPSAPVSVIFSAHDGFEHSQTDTCWCGHVCQRSPCLQQHVEVNQTCAALLNRRMTLRWDLASLLAACFLSQHKNLMDLYGWSCQCLPAAVAMDGTQKCLARKDASVAWEWYESRCFLLCDEVRGLVGAAPVELLKSVILGVLFPPWRGNMCNWNS